MQLRHPNRPRGLNFVPAEPDQFDQAMPPVIRSSDSISLKTDIRIMIKSSVPLLRPSLGWRSGSGIVLYPEGAPLPLVRCAFRTGVVAS